MASRYLKAAIPQAQSVYTPMPLEFISQTIAGDQLKYNQADASMAEASKINQLLSPWAEEQGYREKLMQQYLPRVEELTKQLHTTGEVGQVVPQLAKLNQQWTNDPLRNTLAKDYEFYEKTYLPFTKEEGYSTAYDEYKTPEGSWNPNIDINKSSSYKRVLWDKDADIHKNIDNWMASSYAQLTGADGAQIEYVGGVPMLVESRNGKIEKKGIDLQDPFWKDLYANSIEGLANQYSTQPTDVGIWMQNKVGDKEAIKDYITNIARFKFFKQQDLTPGNQNYSALPNSGSGSGGVGVTTEDYNLITTPFKGVDASTDIAALYTNNKNLKTQVATDKKILLQETYNDLYNNKSNEGVGKIVSSVDQTLNNMLTQMSNDGEFKGNIFKEEKVRNILSNPEIGFNSLIGDKSGRQAQELIDLIGNEGYESLKNNLFSNMIDLAKSPDQENATMAQNFFNAYNNIETKETLAKNQDKVYDVLTESVIEQALSDRKINTPQQGQLSVELTPKIRARLQDKEDPLRHLVSAFIKDPEAYKDLYHGGGEVPDVELDLAKELAGYIKGANITPELTKVQQQELVYEITSGNTTGGEKKGELANFTQGMLKIFQENPNALLDYLQDYGIDKNSTNKNKFAPIFNNSVLKTKGFDWASDAKITDVALARLSEGSMPALYITAKDKNGNASTIPVQFNDSNISNLGKIVTQMITDDNTHVRNIGAELYSRAAINDADLGMLSALFNMKNSSENSEGQFVNFKTKNGEEFAAFIGKNNKISLGSVQGYDENGNPLIKPIDTQKTEKGDLISGDDLNSFNEALQLLGYYNLGKIQSKSQFNYSGNSGGSSEGKSPQGVTILQ